MSWSHRMLVSFAVSLPLLAAEPAFPHGISATLQSVRLRPAVAASDGVGRWRAARDPAGGGRS